MKLEDLYSDFYKHIGERHQHRKSILGVTQRKCLKCGKVFPSRSKTNRLCIKCGESNKRFDGKTFFDIE